MQNELVEEKPQAETPDRIRESVQIERAKEGEEAAFDFLMKKYQPEIARRIKRLCRNEEDAKDIVQEVMLSMYRKIDRFEGRSSLSTWLYRIATNEFLMHERRKKRDRLTFSEYELYNDHAEHFPWYRYGGTDGFTHVYERELADSVSEALEKLPECYRQVILLRRRAGLSLKETSRRVGISVASVKSRQYRGKQILESRLNLDDLRN